ncbi:MAG TPA: acyl carrier protein [Dermatophilaceae bacterium]|nr:acyl carrier protein [Dermatophilaceae bacterium]
MTNTRDRIQEILRDVLDLPDLVVSDRTVASEVPGWDSLAHVSLMFSIEAEFAIAFSDVELAGFADVGELVAVVDRKVDHGG